MINISAKQLIRTVSSLFLIVFFLSCKKDVGNGNPADTQMPDLAAQVVSSVSGFVTDEHDAAMAGVEIKAGMNSVLSDQYGYFELKNVSVSKTAAVVTASKAGYFKGIKTWIGNADKAAFFRIRLIPKTDAGSISATSGGNVQLSNGLTVSLPANGVVNASTHSLYTGNVHVAASWIDPTSPDLQKIMPGDLRGIDEAGLMKKLASYGMAAVELTGDDGSLLQVAPGQKATLTFPLPSSLQGSAPATIPLWYFDETAGLWKEDGAAIRNGNNYVGEVSHFSFWNCDVPSTYIQFDCTIVNSSGQPVPFAAVKVSMVSDPNNNAWGYTDYNGYVAGAVPDNAQLLLEVFSDYGCTNAVYSQSFSTTNVSLSLGNITINSSSTAEISGTVTNCSSNPVTNGYVVMINGTQYGRYPISGTGSFNFSTPLCTASINPVFVATDLSTSQQSNPLTVNVIPGNNAIGNLQACGLSSAEFFSYSINGTGYGFTAPTDTLYHSNYGGTNQAHVGGINTTNHYTYISFDNTGIALNSVQDLVTFYSTDTPDSAHVSTPVGVTITEYGSIGQFISGNFTGTFTGTPPANLPYLITGSFRVRRNF